MVTFTDVTDDGLTFSNITVTEQSVGTTNSVVGDAAFTPTAAPNILGNTVAGLRWTGFVGGASRPGSSLTLTVEYDITALDPMRLLSAISTNSFIPDSAVPAGVTLSLSEQVFNATGTLLGQSTLTKTQSGTDTFDPPFEIGDLLTFGTPLNTVHVTITLSISVASTAAANAGASFSAMTQGFNTVAATYAALGDFVFEDADADGVQDSGEAGIADVTVELLNSSGAVVGTTTTGAMGGYSFSSLVPGIYSVRFVTPDGYMPTIPNEGDDATDSDAVGGVTQQVTLASGEVNGTLDAGFYRPAALGDFVFEDNNRNGVQDSGEAGIADVTVELLDPEGRVVASTTTDGDGAYSFTGLTPGTYSVSFVTPDGYLPTLANQGDDAADSDPLGGLTAEVTLASGEVNGTLDAGYFRLAGLGDYVFEDSNRNGVQDSGESGIAGVTVELLDLLGAVLASTTTDGDGAYSFTNLIPGTYHVRFATPDGYEATIADQGDDAADSDAVGGVSAPVTIASGEFNGTIDAGFFQRAALGDFVFEDLNANGVQDGGEAGIGDVTVELRDSNGAVVAITTTNGDGAYSFTELLPGTYSVTFVTPFGYMPTTPNQGGDTSDSDAVGGATQQVTLASGEVNGTLDAGYFRLAGLGDYVFEDNNANGIQDAGDTALSGVVIELLDADGNVVAATSSDANGAYSFTDLVPGSYSVRFTTPAGYIATGANQGDDSADSDPVGSVSQPVTLASAAFNGTIDAGYFRKASLGDRVFLDADKDGIQDDGEVGIANVTVKLLDAAGTVIATAQTDADGLYGFVDLDPGTYSTQFVAPSGYTATLANAGDDAAADSDINAGGATGQVTLASGEHDSTLDAGYYETVVAMPRIDIEQTTSGSSNRNTTAADYDNEDAANSAGVPILVAGSDVTWTYKVTNTGNVAFTRSEIAIIDDNGTVGNAADDMSVANGRITLLTKLVGDGDDLLEAGEEWIYQASGTAQSLTTTGVTTTFDFSGNSAIDGTDGNIRSYSAGGVSVKASAFSRVDGSSGTWSKGWLGSYSGGLGVTDSGEGNGSGDVHTVDNMGGRDNYVLFAFDQQVVVDKAYLGYVAGDSDLTLWIGTIGSAFTSATMLSDSVLSGLGFTEVNATTLTSARWADFNAGNLAGNVLVVAASTSSAADDRFKIDQLTVKTIGSTGIYENTATVTAGAASDFDLSHYASITARAGIDLEKTTNGPSNNNVTAPTWDNEDSASGAGVPVLTVGSAVAWTYKVANTGDTAMTAGEIVLVDDNGTASTADDMSLANGRIVFSSVALGDGDNLLEAGESWLYTASGVVQNTTAPSVTATFDFSGNSAIDGTDGNFRSYSAGGVSVKTSAFSRVDGTSGAWSKGWLGSYSGGLGVTDSGEGNGSGDVHTVDNMGGRDNYVLFAFDQQVVVDKAYLGYVAGDSDLTLWIGTIGSAFTSATMLSDSVLNGLGFTEVNATTLTSARWADFNAGNLAGNVLVVAASTSSAADDRFKIDQLVVKTVGQAGVYENKATVTAQGVSDSDLSHYTGVVAKPGIDIEKTTNGTSNKNTTAPTWDNEDSATGAGVPILTPGSTVTWTYKVTNTGNTTMTTSDIRIVDDNGTLSTTDDMSLANGRIMFSGVALGDGDNLLESGESWLYTASGIVQDLRSFGSATTFDFSGNTATDGTDGNIRSYSSGGIAVKASAFSRMDGTSGAWSNGWLGSYSGGLGVTDTAEGNGSGDVHTVDNMGGGDNYVMFAFDQKVAVDKAYLGYVVGDSDLTVWIGTISNAFTSATMLSDSVLAGLGFTEVNETTFTSARWADLNAGNMAGNVLIIAANTTDASPEDRFKIDQLVVRKAPTIDIYDNTVTITAQGASDSDLSHYTNADIW